ncbi:nucleoporin Nup120/160 [Tanacetum coccineum]
MVVGEGAISRSADEIREISINLSSDLEREVLLKVLWCTRHLSEHLGKGASVIFYECCFNKPLRSPESIMMRIVNVLATSNVLERGPTNHKTNTNFSMDMLVSLRELYSVAGTWDAFVEVGLMYLNFLVSQRNQNGSDSGLVFESIFTILLLLNYMLKISAQIYMSREDVSTVQVRLIRPTQQIIMEWNKPSHLPVVEDFIYEFSLLQTVCFYAPFAAARSCGGGGGGGGGGGPGAGAGGELLQQQLEVYPEAVSLPVGFPKGRDSSTNQRSLDLGLRKRAPRGTSSASE